jgi:hypothetical protein
MKWTKLFWLALLSFATSAVQSAAAGSAVAWAPGQLGTAYGGPVEIAKKRALENCRRKGGVNPRIIGATDVTGYGAVAVARQPGGRGSLIGVSLGKRSATEANTLAIEQCVKAGGTHAQVRWAWRG